MQRSAGPGPSVNHSSSSATPSAPYGRDHGRFLSRDGVRLHYRDEGTGPALVLIHGWIMDLTAWDAEQPAWSRHLRVLRMDRRGFGHSGGRPAFAADADDVLALLDHCGIGRTAVLGMSQGARIALDLVQRAPERLSALVLDGSPAMEGLPGGPWLQETPLERYRKLLEAEGIDRLRVELAAHPLLQLRSREPAARQAFEAMLARYDGADLADPSATVAPQAVDFATLRAPTLVINGEQDTAQRLAVGDSLARLIPGAMRLLIPGAGHLACLDAPDAYGRIVSDFLREHAFYPSTNGTETP